MKALIKHWAKEHTTSSQLRCDSFKRGDGTFPMVFNFFSIIRSMESWSHPFNVKHSLVGPYDERYLHLQKFFIVEPLII